MKSSDVAANGARASVGRPDGLRASALFEKLLCRESWRRAHALWRMTGDATL